MVQQDPFNEKASLLRPIRVGGGFPVADIDIDKDEDSKDYIYIHQGVKNVYLQARHRSIA